MVRSTILLSAIIACISSISAIPAEGSLVNIQNEDTIGIENLLVENVLNGLGEIHDNDVNDILNHNKVLSGGGGSDFDGDNGGGNGGDGGSNGGNGGSNGGNGGSNGGNGGNNNGNGGSGGNGGRQPINRPSRRPHRPYRPYRPDIGYGYDHVHGPGCGCMKRDNGIDLAKRGDHRRSSKNRKGRSKNGKATMNKMDSKSA